MRAFISDVNDSGDQVPFSKTDATPSGNLRHVAGCPIPDATRGLNKRGLIFVHGGDIYEFSSRNVLVADAEVRHDGVAVKDWDCPYMLGWNPASNSEGGRRKEGKEFRGGHL